ncbi:MAG TPA: phosphotransferase [Caulobacteraceae bacterium]
MNGAPDDALAERVHALLGWAPEAWRQVRGGYTPAARYVVSRGGERAFVKAATTRTTAAMLRREMAAYQAVNGAVRPVLIGCEDHDTQPLLAIEDLSAADWPPPWTSARLDAVLATIDKLHRSAAPLPSFEAVHGPGTAGWGMVAADPGPFLSLGLASPEWLAAVLPGLLAAEAACPTAGAAPCHFDLRSDNMCLLGSAAKLIDWAAASLGNPDLDLGFWLASLHYEGGPAPDEVLPAAPGVAAYVSGYFAGRAGLPIIPDAPFVRRVQREQLTTALPWAQRALALPAL